MASRNQSFSLQRAGQRHSLGSLWEWEGCAEFTMGGNAGQNLPFNLTRFGPDPVDEFTLFLKKQGRSQEEIANELNELFEWIGD